MNGSKWNLQSADADGTTGLVEEPVNSSGGIFVLGFCTT